jgi:subtilisin family serine protease
MSKDSIHFKFGGQDLELTKSTHLVGLRSKNADAQALEVMVQKLSVQSMGEKLGGFQVMGLAPDETFDETLNTLRLDSSIQTGTHVYHTSDDGVPFVPTGEIYLLFKDSAKPEACQELLDEYRLEVIESHAEKELTVKVTAQSPNPIKVTVSLQKSEIVEVAEPDLATPGSLMAFSLPTDVLLNQQWHLENSGFLNGSSLGLKKGADARVVAAWKAAQSLGAPQVIVAVIDDGFDLSHPDLSGAGKIVAPWDFIRNTADPKPDMNKAGWHGTACAGVAIGHANGSGILGAAPLSRFMPIRWGSELSNTSITAWFDHARIQGASVVSCSWKADATVFALSTPMLNTISRCATQGRQGKGCVICFAAGNENQDIQAPNRSSLNGFAIHPDVIAVAACTSRDERSDYSNFGDAISVCAPSSGAGGRGIFTSDVIGTFLHNGQQRYAGYSSGAFTDSFGGTSSSTPLVAGICALLLSLKPDLTARDVKTLIQDTARKIGSSSSYKNDHSREFGYGCIDAAAAVNKLLGTTLKAKKSRQPKS